MTKLFAIATGLLFLLSAAGTGRAVAQDNPQAQPDQQSQSQMGQQQQPGQQQPGQQQMGQQPGQQQPGQQQQQQMGSPSAGAQGTRNIALGEVVPLEGKVIKIDREKRTVTLQGPEGRTMTLRADPKAQHFNELKVGDEIKAQYFQGVIVGASEQGSEPAAGMDTITAESSSGQAPSQLRMRTVTMQAKVDSVDKDHHTVTLTGPEGHSQTFRVSPDVDLNKLNAGQTINVRYVEGVAVELQRK